MSSKIERDLILANKIGIRSIFFSENANVDDFMFMKYYKPEFHVISHLHFPSVLEQINRDIVYLDKKFGNEGYDFHNLDCLHELPSQNLINVGVWICFTNGKTENYYLNNGIFMNSNKLKYSRISLDVPLEHQGPFNAVVWKLVRLLKDFNDDESMYKVKALEKYWENNDVVLINKSEYVKNLLTRYQWYTIANLFLKSENCKEIWRDFNKIARTSKMILVDKSKTTDRDHIEQHMKISNIEYPIVVKSNKTFNTKFSHSKYFIIDSDGLNELFSNEELLKEDLVIEELVPHSEDLLIKIHWFSDKTMFWRVEKSIPDSYVSTNVWLNEDIRKRSSKESHGSICYDNKEFVESEDRFDLKFLHEIWTNLMKTIKVNFIGFDFIISSIDGS